MSDTPTFGFADTSYQAAGGYEGVRHLVDCFYQAMEAAKDPDTVNILEMHPSDLTLSRDKLTCFLVGWMGGPKEYAERYGPINIPRVHQHLTIGHAEKNAWLKCMQIAVDMQPYSTEFKQYLMTQLAFPAERIRVTSKASLD